MGPKPTAIAREPVRRGARPARPRTYGEFTERYESGQDDPRPRQVCAVIPLDRLKGGDIGWVLRQRRGGDEPGAAASPGIGLRTIETTCCGAPDAAGWAGDVAPRL
jgi:hypothetical protein